MCVYKEVQTKVRGGKWVFCSSTPRLILLGQGLSSSGGAKLAASYSNSPVAVHISTGIYRCMGSRQASYSSGDSQSGFLNLHLSYLSSP